MGNKNLSSCGNYLYCIKNSESDINVNTNSDINIQQLSELQPSKTKHSFTPTNIKKLVKEGTLKAYEKSTGNNESHNSTHKTSLNSHLKKLLINTIEEGMTNEVNDFDEGGDLNNQKQPAMNIYASKKSTMEEKRDNNTNAIGNNININLSNQLVINYINNDVISNQEELNCNKEKSKTNSYYKERTFKGIKSTDSKYLDKQPVVTEGPPSNLNNTNNNSQFIFHKHTSASKMNNLNTENTLNEEMNQANEKLQKIVSKNFDISNSSSQVENEDNVFFNNIYSKQIVDTENQLLEDNLIPLNKNIMENLLGFKIHKFKQITQHLQDMCRNPGITVKDLCLGLEEQIVILTYINRVSHLQRAYKQYITFKAIQYESKVSINNVSYMFRDDKAIKFPPEIFKPQHMTHHSVYKVGETKKSDLSSRNLPLNITKNSFESRSNSMIGSHKHLNANTSDYGLNCKFFKMKSDNKVVKLIKRFIKEEALIEDKVTDNSVFGVKEYSNGSRIIGLFNEKNEAEGVAVYVCHKTSFYLGLFKKNYLSGFGYSKGSSECCYLGEWSSSKQEGLGVEIWANGSLYKGEFRHGKKHGLGTYIWKSGAVYSGHWEKNRMDGEGILKFETGNIYYGGFRHGSMHGFGDFVWSSGKSYSGFYQKDLKEGLGLFYWNNPLEIYFGYWAKGQRDGPAIQINSQQRIYSHWDNGKKVKSFNSKQEASVYVLNINGVNRKYKVFFDLDLDDMIKKYSKKVTN